MSLLRPISVIVGFAVLLVNSGDCVNLLFANAKEAECCMRADCPFAATEQMDSCCATPVAPAKYLQAATQESISQPSVSYVDFPTEAFAGPIVKIAAYFLTDAKSPLPPGAPKALNTPLLI